MKKSANSINKKFSSVRSIGLAAIILIAAVFISALPNIRAQASENSSFFGLADLFNWQTETVAPQTSNANDDIIASPLDIRTVCSAGGADLLTIAAAVTEINSGPVPAGGRTYNVCAGHTETLTAALGLTTTGTVADPIVFQKNGAGANPLVTAYVGTATPTSATPDGMFRIQGGDYITIDGIDFTDPNAANPATMEYGIGLFKGSLSNGAQNNTVKNSTITVKTINNAAGTAPMIEGSVGILMINSTATAAVTALTPTAAAGTNSNNKFYTNTINGGNYGMGLIGFAGTTPFTTCDFNNDIGGAALATGNIIQNFGGGAATSPSAGIRTLAQYSINVSYNTVNNNTGANTNHATTFRGIYLNTATSANATISNNTVTLKSGATTSAVTAIENQSGSTAASNTIAINNNTVSGAYTTATTGVWSGIVNGSTAATVNINSNIMTGFDLAGTGTHVMIETGSPTTATANSNSITSITRGGASGSWRIIKTTSPTNLTVSSNTISGLSWTAAASTGSISPIYSFSSAVNVTANSNTITNLSTPTNGSIIGIQEFGISGLKTFQNNTISNFSTTAGGAGGATFTGISESTGSTNDISGNKIFSLNSTGTTGGTAGTITGITVSSGTTNNIYKNKIYDLSTTSTGPTVAGITQSGGTTNTIYNNLIGDLRTPAANAANPLIGLNITGGTTNNIYFNTIYLNGASTGALFGSSAISASTTPALTLRNNIFSNTSTVAGAGLAVAYRRSSTTLTTYQSASNNNDFNASTIYTDGTNTDVSIAGYKTRVSGRDSASFNEAPMFLSTTGSSAQFLHISTASPTQLESGGAAISGITDDFDGETRNASTPDIGADEFAGIPSDLTAPSISYTALTGTASLANRNLTVTITDASGVAGGANSPRIYFKKSTDAGYVSTQCAGASPTYTCTIDYTLVGGGSVMGGDMIQYFVVAQDTAGNVGANPSGGFSATSVNSVMTPPTTPNTYTILPTISGNKTVGSAAGSDYPTLTAAVAALNGAELSGAVTLTLTDASYSAGETFPLTITANNGSSATNTVTIKPAAGISPVISGSSAACIIGFSGADYMTIDGSNGNGTTRDLTITNTNAGVASAVVCIQNTAALDGATNNVVKNANIVGNTNITTLFGVFSGGTAISATSVGTGNNANTVQNNNLSKSQYGIYSQGASAANKNTGTVITQNLMNTATPNNIGRGGIMTGFENNLQITQNTIDGIVHGISSVDALGITLGFVGVNPITNTSTTGNEVTNAVVSRNVIGSVSQTATYSACGICVASAATGTNRIDNNFVSGVIGNGTVADFTAGMFIGGGAGTTQIYFNSVSMSGTLAGSAGVERSYALAIQGSNPIIDIRNNILSNTQVITTSTLPVYAIGLQYAAYTNLTSNNNDLFTTTGALFKVGRVGNLDDGGTDQTLLADWQTATGKDAASVSGDPKFISATNLHIDTSMTTVVSNAGTPVAGITIDIDGDTRTATPDIGADEFTPPAGAGTLQFSAAAYTDTEGNNATITVSRVGGTAGAISVMYATSDGTATSGICGSGGDYQSATGTLNFADTVTSQTFNVQLCNDASAESSETVTLTLSNPVGTTITGTNPATLNITDNPPGTVQFSTTTYSGSEGMTATITATRTGGGSGVVTVDYATIAGGTATGGSCPGSDYATTNGTLTWASNDTMNKTFTVQLCGDTAVEATETVNLALSNVTGGATLGTAAATLNIFDVASQFCNADGTISIPTVGTSTPYPSVINVSGLSGNTNTVRVTLNNAQHTDMTDLDILLVSPTGQKFILMSDASTNAGLDLPATLTFSDAGALLPTAGQVPSGTYQPRDVTAGDTFAAPAPTGPYVSPASVGTGTLNGTFGGANPNGAWNLYVVDDASGDTGSIGGWCLEITTVAVVVPTVDLSVNTNSASETGPTSVTVTATASSAVVSDQTVDLTVTGTGITAGDYTLSPTTITILSGQTTGTATFTVVDDLLVEGTETATITEGNPSGGITLGATTFQNVAITDNDVANTPPTISAVGVTRQEGSPVSNSTIANVTDTESGNGAVIVTVVGATTVNGVTISNIVNTSGGITANVVAACGATNATFTLQASDGTLTSTATLNVTVTANTAPTLTYNTASVAGGGGTTVNPATATDNGSITGYSLVSQGTYAGGFLLNTTTGVVTITAAAPIGSHTITIRATDNCGATTDASFMLNVTNNNPTITAGAAVTRQQGSTGSTATIATVSDPDQTAGTLTVTATTLPTDITVTPIVNSSGTVTAVVTAGCNATVGANTVVLTVMDSNGGSATANYTVNVTANTAPTLTYPASASVGSGGSTTITPLTGPSDTGLVSTIAVQSQGTYTGGTISVDNATGVVTITGAAPVGMHTITIRATDNCGLFTDATFTLNVSAGDTTAPVLTYTPIPNQSTPSNVSLPVTITDAVGVTSANIFVSVNGGAFVSTACSGTSGSTNSVWNCPITGTASGQSISYYVAATDAASNTGSNPLAGMGAPNLYTIGAATVPAGNYTNVSLSSGTTTGGAVTVSEVLTLGGIVDIGANTITIGCTGSIANGGTNNYIIGNLAKEYCAPQTFVYPVGTTPNGSLQLGVGTEYSEFTAVVTAGTFPSTLTVSVTDAFLPGSSILQSASRYWDVTENGTLTADISFVYLDILPGYDANGDQTTYQVLRRESSTTAVYAGGTVNAATNTATAPGVTNFSQWAAGVLAPVAASVEVGGRVAEATGQGISQARVVLTDMRNNKYTTYTNSFGNYHFEGIEAGQTVFVTVGHRRFNFAQPTQVFNVNESVTNADFVSSVENE